MGAAEEEAFDGAFPEGAKVFVDHELGHRMGAIPLLDNGHEKRAREGGNVGIWNLILNAGLVDARGDGGTGADYANPLSARFNKRLDAGSDDADNGDRAAFLHDFKRCAAGGMAGDHE